MMIVRPIAWTIAGTDPSGGAGIQADLKAFHSLGVYGGSAITAVIAQNTLGVRRVEPVAPDLLAAQLEALVEDLPPRAIKIGMLGTASNVAVVARVVDAAGVPVICDPVLAASAGGALLDETGVEALLAKLLPRVTLVTPNLPEASRLCDFEVNDAATMRRAAERLLETGVGGVLIKGGHASDGIFCRDLLALRDGRRQWLAGPRLQVNHGHGAGCTLSAAIAAFLAHGQPLPSAVVLAKAYVTQGLRHGGGIGRGRGPLAHLGWPGDPADLPQVEEERPATPAGGFHG